MSNLKAFIYEWGGANHVLFWGINGIRQKLYDQIIALISWLGDYERFPYYVAAILTWVMLSVLVRFIRKKKGIGYYFSSWVGVLVVLALGFGVNGIVIKTIKEVTALPRPQVVFNHDIKIETSDYFKGRENTYTVQEYKAADLRVLEKVDAEDLYRSFPSGHVAFTIFMVVALWPVMNSFFAKLSILFILLVAWSRVSLGVHFPADVIGSILISTPLMLIVRYSVYTILFKVFRIKC